MKASSPPSLRVALPLALGSGIILLLASSALAHSGPKLDEHGCHSDRVRGNVHCHRGELDGMTFDSRGAMLEAVASGKLPEPKKKENFLDRMVGALGGDDEEPAAEAATEQPAAQAPLAPVDVPAQPAPTAAATPGPTAPERTIEERLKKLKGLYDLQLITKAEYDTRRTEILSEL